MSKDKVVKADNKEKLAAAMAMIHKKYGKDSIMVLDSNFKSDIDFIPTGSLALNRALGIGGFPRGRVCEIYGPEASGKTTLTLHTIAEAQKKGIVCAFIDAEHALDPTYARALGVDLESLMISQPSNGEEAFNIADDLINSNLVGLIIIDSVAALTPKAEIEGEVGDYHVGVMARMMSQGLRKISGGAKKNNCTVIFINQIRMKIGVMFGNPETTTGGNALKYYSSVRIDIRRVGALKEGDKIIGNETKIKIVKNKVAPPFKEALTTVVYGKGFDYISELIDFAVEYNVMLKAGAWYSYNGTKTGQGKANTAAFLTDGANKEIYDEIRSKVYAALDLKD